MPAVLVTWSRCCFSGLQDKEERFLAVVVVFFYSKKNNYMQDCHLELAKVNVQGQKDPKLMKTEICWLAMTKFSLTTLLISTHPTLWRCSADKFGYSIALLAD